MRIDLEHHELASADETQLCSLSTTHVFYRVSNCPAAQTTENFQELNHDGSFMVLQ